MQGQTLGRRIQEERRSAGLSQEALGERLGVSRQAVSKWEADAAVPELESLIAMSRIFGVTIGALLGVETPEEAPETGGAASEETEAGTAPAGELTDRELAAVEAIVQKYLEAAGKPRWSQRRKVAAAVGIGAALALTGLALGGLFSDLGRRLDRVQDQVDGIQSSVSGQIGSLTGQLSDLLEEQSSIVSDFDVRVTDYDPDGQVWLLSVSVTPKEYGADTAVAFTARTGTGETASAEARNEGGIFTVENWAVPMGEAVGGTGGGGAQVEVSASFRDGEAIRTQALETLYESPADYRLSVDGYWNADWENGYLTLQQLDLKIGNDTGIPLELAEAELALFPNGEAEPLWSAPLTAAVDLWEKQGYVQMFSPAGPAEPVRIEPGDSLVAAVRIADDHGQSFWYLLGSWLNKGSMYREHPDSLNSQYDSWQPGEELQLWSH